MRDAHESNMRYNFMLTRIIKIKKDLIIENVVKDIKQLEHSYIAGGSMK